MTNTIQDTVQQSLNSAGYGSYQQYAAPVVTALVNREQEIVGRLIQFAEGSDLDVNAVRQALDECGMHMPAQQQNQQATSGETPDLAQTLVNINNTLAGLAQFARQHGYQG